MAEYQIQQSPLLRTSKSVFAGGVEGEWTPALTFLTPGDVSVSYSVQKGLFRKFGREVTADFAIATSAFTHTTASGSLRITGLPYVSDSNGLLTPGTLYFRGITKANYTQYAPIVEQDETFVLIGASGSGQTNSVVFETDVPTGGTVVLRGRAHYFTTTT